MQNYSVYILASWSRVLYIGVTNDLHRRVSEHRVKSTPGFTTRDNATRLVHHETNPGPTSAISREKELKGWLRQRKLALIEISNPTWRDLYDDIAG